MTEGRRGRDLARRSRLHLGRWLARTLLGPAGARRLRGLLAAEGGRLRGAFFVVAPPGSWDVLRPCLALLRRRAAVCVVGNGAGPEERAACARAYPEIPRIELPVLPRTLWAHGTVLNLLVRGVAAPFGVLDHDCYVFDETLLAGLACGERELALGIDLPGFVTWNERAGLRLPRTHWLFLNAPLLRSVMAHHAVDCEKATRTPRPLAPLLAAVGLGDHNFPPPHLPFYDTLQLLLAVGIAEGATVRYLSTGPEGIAHLGGATRQQLRRARDW